MSLTESGGANGTGADSIAELVRLLLEDRRVRGEELAEERARRESAETRQSKQLEEQLQIMKTALDRMLNERRGLESCAPPEKITLTKLTEGDDIEDYLTTFERLMAMYHVDKTQWVAKLAPQLSGRALKAYAAMPSGDALVYDEVKKALLTRYGISEETYRQKFRMARRKKGEAYMELATRSTDLFRKWTATCSNMEADKMIRKQLLNNMPTDLRIWLGERKPKSCREAGILADDYVLACHRGCVDFLKNTQEDRKPGGSAHREEQKCYLCQQPGHFARNCPKKTQDMTPEIPEPISQSPTPATPTENSGQNRHDRKCYNCHKWGHIAAQCPGAFYCGPVKERGGEVLGGWEHGGEVLGGWERSGEVLVGREGGTVGKEHEEETHNECE